MFIYPLTGNCNGEQYRFSECMPLSTSFNACVVIHSYLRYASLLIYRANMDLEVVILLVLES